MNTTRVSSRRNYGVLAITMLLSCCISSKSAEITITVKGTLSGGTDRLHIFGASPTMPGGTPYTLVYTFDDTKGQAFRPCGGSGIAGKHENSPGTAVLTINGKSYTFGARKDAASDISRTVASSCSANEIAIDIGEGQYPLFTTLKTRVPIQASGSQDWRSPLTLSKGWVKPMFNTFTITRPGVFVTTASYILVESITVNRK